jgi:hypothetical protein
MRQSCTIGTDRPGDTFGFIEFVGFVGVYHYTLSPTFDVAFHGDGMQVELEIHICDRATPLPENKSGNIPQPV